MSEGPESRYQPPERRPLQTHVEDLGREPFFPVVFLRGDEDHSLGNLDLGLRRLAHLIPALAVDSDRSQGETLRLAAELSQNVVQTFGFTRVLLQADDGQAAEIRYVRYESQSGAGWSCSVTF